MQKEWKKDCVPLVIGVYAWAKRGRIRLPSHQHKQTTTSI